MQNSDAQNKLIVALDYTSLEEARQLVELLGDRVLIYKAGLEIFLRTKGRIVEYLHENGKKVFLDLKFHDITNTVVQACTFAAEQGVFMFNVHCANGEKTLKAVADMLKEKKSAALCIGVTVLTNLAEQDIQTMYGSTVPIIETVETLAAMVHNSGLHGIVCSAKEAAAIKQKMGTQFITVCPGVRPSEVTSDTVWQNRTEDQHRIMTPSGAIKNGADYLVIGRPITMNPDPLQAVESIVAEIEQALR